MAGFTGSYATAAYFKSQAPEIDLTGIDDPALLVMLTRASRTAEAWVHVIWGQHTVTGEDHDWRESRRAYLRHWPVQALTEAKLYLGATVVATLDTAAFLISNTFRFIEYSSLALAMSITPSLITFGLSEPILRVSYTAGYIDADIPEMVRIAVCIIVASHIIQRRMIEQNLGGVISMTVGSYTITVARPKSEDELSGFAGVLPPEARGLLNDFRVTHVR